MSPPQSPSPLPAADATVLLDADVVRVRRRVERAWAAAFAVALIGAGGLVLHLQSSLGMAWLLLAGAGLLAFLTLLGVQRRFWLGPLTARSGRRLVDIAEQRGLAPAAMLAASEGADEHHFIGVMLRAAGVHPTTGAR